MAKGHHILPFANYVKVFIILLLLTAFTVWTAKASYFDFGAVANGILAMSIATLKAGLVAAFFMHLKYESKSNLACLLASVFFLLVMFIFIFVDMISRIPEVNTL